MADPWAGGPEPTGRVRFKEMPRTLVFDVAVPILVFTLFTGYGVATLWARLAIADARIVHYGVEATELIDLARHGRRPGDSGEVPGDSSLGADCR
jgi:hypothetical protein